MRKFRGAHCRFIFLETLLGIDHLNFSVFRHQIMINTSLFTSADPRWRLFRDCFHQLSTNDYSKSSDTCQTDRHLTHMQVHDRLYQHQGF